jgi:hypothetical protein
LAAKNACTVVIVTRTSIAAAKNNDHAIFVIVLCPSINHELFDIVIILFLLLYEKNVSFNIKYLQ